MCKQHHSTESMGSNKLLRSQIHRKKRVASINLEMSKLRKLIKFKSLRDYSRSSIVDLKFSKI